MLISFKQHWGRHRSELVDQPEAALEDLEVGLVDWAVWHDDNDNVPRREIPDHALDRHTATR